MSNNNRRNAKTNKNQKSAKTVQKSKTPAEKKAKKKWSFKNLFNKKQTNKATKLLEKQNPKNVHTSNKDAKKISKGKLSEQTLKNLKELNIKEKELVTVPVKKHKDSNGNHYHGIIDSLEENYVSVGFTTSKTKGKGTHNYKLKIDPLDNGKPSYMRRQGTVDKKNKYYNDYKGKMTPEDHAKATEYAEKAKQKYITKKKSKTKKIK